MRSCIRAPPHRNSSFRFGLEPAGRRYGGRPARFGTLSPGQRAKENPDYPEINVTYKMEPMENARHQCMIYSGSPWDHLRGLANIARGKLEQDWRCLYLNTPEMVAGMRSALSDAGVDLDREIQKGRLILSSDRSHLIGGRFDIEEMLSSLEKAVEQVLSDGLAGLWASGDMAWEFGEEKDFSKLLEYEHSLERLFAKHTQLCGICQYHAEALPTDAIRWGLYAHRTLYFNEYRSEDNPFYAPETMLSAPRHEVSRREMESILAQGALRMHTGH